LIATSAPTSTITETLRFATYSTPPAPRAFRRAPSDEKIVMPTPARGRSEPSRNAYDAPT